MRSTIITLAVFAAFGTTAEFSWAPTVPEHIQLAISGIGLLAFSSALRSLLRRRLQLRRRSETA